MLSDERLVEIEQTFKIGCREIGGADLELAGPNSALSHVRDLLEEVKRLRQRCHICRHGFDRWCRRDGDDSWSHAPVDGLCDCSKFESMSEKGMNEMGGIKVGGTWDDVKKAGIQVGGTTTPKRCYLVLEANESALLPYPVWADEAHIESNGSLQFLKREHGEVRSVSGWAPGKWTKYWEEIHGV